LNRKGTHRSPDTEKGKRKEVPKKKEGVILKKERKEIDEREKPFGDPK